ncbi:MAG: ComEC/Rec2 family competence protein [Planctomycetota bacterium]
MFDFWGQRWQQFYPTLIERKNVLFTELLYRYPMLLLALTTIGAGILGRSIAPNSWLKYFFLCCGVLVCIGGLLVFRRPIRQTSSLLNSGSASIGAMLLGAIFLGLFVGQNSKPTNGDSLALSASRRSVPIATRVIVTTAPVWKPNPNHRPQDPRSEKWKTQWIVQCEAHMQGTAWKPISAECTLSVDGRIDDYFPGDVIEVYGSFRSIYPATNPGGFDLAEHQAKYGRFVFLSADSVEQLSLHERRYSYIFQRLRALAVVYVDRLLHRWIEEDNAPLAAALVFGQRQQVDWQEQQQLMATGTLHLLAISGMHVEIVASSFLLLCWLIRIGDRTRLALIISVCCLYAALADGKPPVLRAAILVIAMEVARYYGRKAKLANLLALAALCLFLMRAVNIENVGVHLSFLAVATIGIFVLDVDPKKKTALDSLLEESTSAMSRLFQLAARSVWGMLRLSFWVWLITGPLVWYHFHVVAPISVPLNVVISIPLGVSLLSGLVTGMLGCIAPIGYVAGRFCDFSLSTIGWLVDLGVEIPCGHFWAPSPSLAWMAVFYGVVILWLIFFRRKYRRTLGALLVLMLAGGLLPSQFGNGTPGKVRHFDSENSEVVGSANTLKSVLKVTFLDVGHGTCVLIEMPTGELWVYDAGHLGAADRSHQDVAAALWEMGYSRIDTLLLSHADSDHYNAVPGLLERFRVGRIVSTKQFWTSQDVAVQAVLERIDALRIPCETWTAGNSGLVLVNDTKSGAADDDAVRWQVLHPDSEQKWESDNASSLCLQLSFSGKRILLPGDLDGTGLFRLVELPERPCHVLMAPHHGSVTRDPTPLLHWCRPELTVISGNHRAASKRVVERYAPESEYLGITFREGAIRYVVAASENQEQPLQEWMQHWSRDRWQKLPPQEKGPDQ